MNYSRITCCTLSLLFTFGNFHFLGRLCCHTANGSAVISPQWFSMYKDIFWYIFHVKIFTISRFCSHVLRLFPYHVVWSINMYRDDSFLPFGNSHFLDILSYLTVVISPMKGFVAILSYLQYFSPTKSTRIHIFCNVTGLAGF